jgi:hypothetical protein
MKSVQNGSKWIKPDPIWISHLSKNVNIKSCHTFHENNHGQHFLTKSDKICPKWMKLNQIWISHLSKNVNMKDIYQENKHGQLFWINET